MTELDITLPSIRHVHQILRDQQNSDNSATVEVKLITGDVITGTLKWIDQNCIGIDGAQAGKSHPMLIWHHAIAYIKS
jgi:host factor-I protein